MNTSMAERETEISASNDFKPIQPANCFRSAGRQAGSASTRLIARGTVEEKVLQLQEEKRDLADAILGGDNRITTNLKREDLELLLSQSVDVVAPRLKAGFQRPQP